MGAGVKSTSMLSPVMSWLMLSIDLRIYFIFNLVRVALITSVLVLFSRPLYSYTRNSSRPVPVLSWPLTIQSRVWRGANEIEKMAAIHGQYRSGSHFFLCKRVSLAHSASRIFSLSLADQSQRSFTTRLRLFTYIGLNHYRCHPTSGTGLGWSPLLL